MAVLWVALVGLLGLSTGAVSNDIIVEAPKNMAATEETVNVEFNCIINLPPDDHMDWTHYIGETTTGTRIYSTTDGENAFPEDYDIYRSGPDEQGRENIMLIVKQVRADLGGKYGCEILLAGEKKFAELVALSPMSCNPEPGQVTIDEGDIAEVACDVDFTETDGEVNKPHLDLLDESGNRLNGFEYTNTPTHAKSTANFTSSGDHDEMELTCLLTFDQPESPEFTDNCTTFFYVNHPVGGLTFSPDPDNFPDSMITIYVGEEVNCSAMGRPAPSYHWLLPGGIEHEGDKLIAKEDMVGTSEYTCVAENDFKGEPRSAQREVRIRVQLDPGTGSVDTPRSHVLLLSMALFLTTLLLS